MTSALSNLNIKPKPKPKHNYVRQELLEKVRRLWNEKYGKFAGPGNGETMGLMIRQPDFDHMTPKELLREYLELLKEKQ